MPTATVTAAAAATTRRTALVVGVANARSIAWASASSLLHHGYDVVVTYQNDRFQKAVEGLVASKNDSLLRQQQCVGGSGDTVGHPRLHCLPCDVSSDDSVGALFEERLPSLLWEDGCDNDTSTTNRRRLDTIVHSVAYAPPDAMKDGSLLGTSRESFNLAHDISAYSLLLLARHALPYLSAAATATATATADGYESSTKATEGSLCEASSSIIALSYLGSTRAVPNYNVMGPAKASLESIVRGLASELGPPPYGVRVNAVSAGPINTLAARGIRGFSEMRKDLERRSMLRRNVSVEEVAEAITFLAGATGITGQTIYVDGGYNAVG